MPRNGSGVMSKPAGTTAVPNTTIESAKYNATIDDIIQDLNNARPITSGGTGATSAAAARDNLGLEIGSDILGINYAPPGLLYGLTLSNNGSDSTNDIDIAVGSAASDGTTKYLMTLSSALTKRLDAAWAVGTNAGGLDAGSIANTTYHVWLIQRSDTGVVDALFSTSATSPTMPTNYDRKRRIGSILRESGIIVAFTQNGDDFSRPAVFDVSVATSTTNVLIALSVPSGIIVQPKMEFRTVLNQTTSCSIQLGSGFESDSLHVVQALRAATGAIGEDGVAVNSGFFTNTSRQLNHSRGVPTGSINTFTLRTVGWIDTRGRI